MKLLSILICILLVLFLFGCTNVDKFQTSVSFYYCVKDIDHKNGSSVFYAETREGAAFEDDLIGLLNVYFAGPENDDLYNPFPTGSSITASKREGNVLTLHLSEEFDKLSLNKLTLAIACLAQTTFSYTSVPVLLLIPHGTFIDGSTYKTFTADSFLYSDQNITYNAPQ